MCACEGVPSKRLSMLCPPAIMVYVGSPEHDEREGGSGRRAKERRGEEGRCEKAGKGRCAVLVTLSSRLFSHVSGSRPSLVYVTSVRSLS